MCVKLLVYACGGQNSILVSFSGLVQHEMGTLGSSLSRLGYWARKLQESWQCWDCEHVPPYRAFMRLLGSNRSLCLCSKHFTDSAITAALSHLALRPLIHSHDEQKPHRVIELKAKNWEILEYS